MSHRRSDLSADAPSSSFPSALAASPSTVALAPERVPSAEHAPLAASHARTARSAPPVNTFSPEGA